MKNTVKLIVGELFFDLDDLTVLGWVYLLLALLFGIAVGAATVVFLFPSLPKDEVNGADSELYGYLLATSILIAAVTPLCLGIPVLRRLGINVTKSDIESRVYVQNHGIDATVEHYIVFEIVRPDENLWNQLVYGLEYNEFEISRSSFQKVVAYKTIYPTINRISAARREIRETLKMAETECMSWRLSRNSPG